MRGTGFGVKKHGLMPWRGRPGSFQKFSFQLNRPLATVVERSPAGLVVDRLTELVAQQLIDLLGVGLALTPLHHLADEKAEHFGVPALVLLHLIHKAI